MTGISIPWAVAALGITTVVYTYVGGMRTVLWSDFIQFVLYLAGAHGDLAPDTALPGTSNFLPGASPDRPLIR